VTRRPEGTVNDKLDTGSVELTDCVVEVLASAEPPPFQLDDRVTSTSKFRLRYRYLDLRREHMQRNLRLRAVVNGALRRAMDAQGFCEVETPLLWAPTPEGSRRVRRALTSATRGVLRAAPEPADRQATLDGRRVRSLLPDRAMHARRGPAGRSPIRVLPTRYRSELRRSR